MATNYFNGTLKQPSNSSTALTTPIQYSCQKNFIILVTDGSPDTNDYGGATDYTTALNGVLPVIDGLVCPANATSSNCKVTYNGTGMNVPVYVLGMGLQPSDQANINQMAIHGTTAINNNTQAYLGSDPGTFMNDLYAIFNNINASVGSGTAASILNNSQGSGSSLLQAVFYPSVLQNGTTISWIGELTTCGITSILSSPIPP